MNNFIENVNLYLCDSDSYMAMEFKSNWFCNFENAVNSLLLLHKLDQKPKGEFVISYCKKILSLIDETKEVIKYDMKPIDPNKSDACDLVLTYRCKIKFPMIVLFNRFMYGIMEQFGKSKGVDDKKSESTIQMFIASVFSVLNRNQTVLVDVVNWFTEPLSERVFESKYNAKMKHIEETIDSDYLIDDDEKIYCLPLVMKVIGEKISAC